MNQVGGQLKPVTLLSAALSPSDRLQPSASEEMTEALNAGYAAIAKVMVGFGAHGLGSPEDERVVDFENPREAVTCAVQMTRAIEQLNWSLRPTHRLALAVGIHCSRVPVDDEWRHGRGLRIVTQLAVLARTGGVFLSSDVYAEVRRRMWLRFVDVGEWPVEGEVNLIRAYQIVFDQSGAKALRALSDALGSLRARIPTWVLALLAVPLVVWLVVEALKPENRWVGPLPTSLAVLPFEGDEFHRGGESYRETIPVGIIEDLRSYGGIELASRAKSFSLHGESDDVGVLGHALGVEGLVVGFVSTAGDQILVRAALVRVSDDYTIWSDAYYREAKEVDAIKREIVLGIANALGLQGRVGGVRAVEISYEQIQAALELALEQSRGLGAGDPRRITSLNNLAAFYYDAGRDAEAIALYQEALENRQEVLGPDHPEVAVSLNNLASVYMSMGRYTEAEPLYLRSLEIRRKSLGPDHPRVGNALANLASLHHRQGRYRQAESLYAQALAIREKELELELGPEAAKLMEEASRYQVRGMYVEAQKYYEESLAAEERASGRGHVRTGSALRNLAVLLGLRGNTAKAEPLLKRSVSTLKASLGPDHPEVGRSLEDLGELYRREGRLVEAEMYHERSLQVYERSLGPEHPEVAETLSYLVTIFEIQGREEDAERTRRRAEAIRESYLGPFSRYLEARSAEHRVLRSRVQDDLDAPQPLQERLVTVGGDVHALQKRRLADSLHNMALLYTDQGRYSQAESHGRKALAIRESLLGSDHPDVALSLHNLAHIYTLQGRYQDAELYYVESRRILEEALGPAHLHVARSWEGFAEMLRRSDRSAEAEVAEQRAREIRLIYEAKSTGA